MNATILVFPILALIVAVPVIVGVYVYRDASRRNMNAALWTLVAAFAPALVGFIIYLLVRENYSDMRCEGCGEAVSEEFVRCPKCGAKLRPACPHCATPVERDWSVCPKCAKPLPQLWDDIEEPVKAKDKTLSKILLAVILIPLTLLIVLLLSYSGVPSSGVTGVTSLPVDEYLKEVDNPQIEEWYEGCGGEYDKAYVLRSESASGGESTVHFLIYMPMLAHEASVSVGTSSGPFGRTTEIRFTDYDSGGGNDFVLVTCKGEPAPKLKILYNEERVELEITEADYPLALTH